MRSSRIPIRAGQGRLRKLEQRLLGAGATVDRTGDDFVRYHGKFMIVDRTTLLVLGFNYTLLDIAKSRSFGIVTKNRKTVQDAIKLFEADCARQPYVPAGSLLVSPENARAQLSAFISKAKKQLLIYDPKVSDPRIVRLLKERVKAGVDVRILGKVSSRGDGLIHQKISRASPPRPRHRPRRPGGVHRQSKPAQARAGQAARSGCDRQGRGDRQGS